jgi:hypothetical protein
MMLVGGSGGQPGGPDADPASVSVELVSLEQQCSNNSSSSSLDGPRMSGVAVALQGQVLVCGGIDGGDTALSTCVSWNMTEADDAPTWTVHSFMNEGRMAAAATRLLGTAYVSGGSEQAHGVEHLEDNGRWQYGPALPDGVRSVYGHCSLPWGEDGLLFLGGVYTASEIIVSRDVLLYNQTTERWRGWPSMTTRRRNLACARVANSSRILVAGGDNDSGDLGVGHQAEVLDIGEDGHYVGGWRPVGRLVEGRKGGQLAVINGGRVVMTGGFSGESLTFLDTMEEFDVETETWSLLDQRLGLKRAAHGLVTIPDTYC